MNKSLLLTLSACACLGLSGALRADAPAATSSTAATGSTAAAGAAAPDASGVAKNDAPGSLKKGKALLDAGKYADAVAYFTGIGEQVADHGKAKREPYRQLDLATAYLGENDYANAEKAAQAALALNPDLEGAWNDLASAQVNSGDRAAAIATYQKGVAQLTKDGADHSRLDQNLQSLQAAAERLAKGKLKSIKKSLPAAVSATTHAAAAVTNAAATVGY